MSKKKGRKRKKKNKFVFSIVSSSSHFLHFAKLKWHLIPKLKSKCFKITETKPRQVISSCWKFPKQQLSVMVHNIGNEVVNKVRLWTAFFEAWFLVCEDIIVLSERHPWQIYFIENEVLSFNDESAGFLLSCTRACYWCFFSRCWFSMFKERFLCWYCFPVPPLQSSLLTCLPGDKNFCVILRHYFQLFWKWPSLCPPLWFQLSNKSSSPPKTLAFPSWVLPASQSSSTFLYISVLALFFLPSACSLCLVVAEFAYSKICSSVCMCMHAGKDTLLLAWKVVDVSAAGDPSQCYFFWVDSVVM